MLLRKCTEGVGFFKKIREDYGDKVFEGCLKKMTHQTLKGGSVIFHMGSSF